MKRWVFRILVVLVVIVLALVVVGVVLHEERPSGKAGEFADLLARRMEGSVERAAWKRTLALKWNFAGRYEHVWDRARNLSRVKWDDVEVLLDLSTKKGIVTKGGARIDGAAAEPYLKKAYERWVNDSFWLNPFPKFFDEGVTRELIELDDGQEAVLIEFSSGGVTPGDAYLWFHDGRYRPNKVKMWVSILPIGGIEVTWERYQTLQTGALVATKHDWFAPFELTEVAGATTMAGLIDPDPFAALVGTTETSSAASRPAR
jgi:hypothetical protein